jgi:hypothetical protein
VPCSICESTKNVRICFKATCCLPQFFWGTRHFISYRSKTSKKKFLKQAALNTKLVKVLLWTNNWLR